jgi:hypothetical protein
MSHDHGGAGQGKPHPDMQPPVAAVLAARHSPLNSAMTNLRQQPAGKPGRWQFGWPSPEKVLMTCWRGLQACGLSAFVS